MHKYNQYVYLLINGALLFLLLCVGYLLSPLFTTLFSTLFKVLSPFVFGFILASLIYPVIAHIHSKVLKMLVILLIYLGLVFAFVTCILVTLPHLINDFYRFLAFFHIDLFKMNKQVFTSLQLSSQVLMGIMNAAVISLFYLFDEGMVAKIYYRIPHHNTLLSRYYDFIEYFYALVLHILIRLGLVLLLMLAIKQPYALIISLLGIVSLVPIVGNIIFYGIMVLCLVYNPIILIPLLLLVLFDLYFYRTHRYNLLKMLVIFIALRIINIYLVVFTLPVYFMVIETKKSSYIIAGEEDHERR
ncbi:MAG: hypothetical protein ACLROI_10535 [Beduini sp.]|uniref:hypothetical protein n=1 Tax=Beduini sp. TaxID=1922300 RepID=UPI0011C7A366